MPFKLWNRQSLAWAGAQAGGGSLPPLAAFTWNPNDSYKTSGVISADNKTVSEQNGSDYISVRTFQTIDITRARVMVGPATEVYFGLALSNANLGGINGMVASAGTYLYRQDGAIYKNGSLVSSSAPKFVSGDAIDVSFDGTNVNWYKNGVLAFKTLRTAGETGDLRPCISAFAFSATLQDS